MNQIVAQVILKSKREKPILNRHPWVFSGAIARLDGAPKPGELVQVLTNSGKLLGVGYYNASSQIRVRLLSWGDSAESPDWRALLTAAIAQRSEFADASDTTAYRLVNAEADGLPGLVIDRYGDHLVMQCLTMGIDVRKQEIADILVALLQPRSIR